LRHEYVLDFIVERKRVDDLWSSIKDNRYKQQKLRLQVSFRSHYFEYLLCSIMLIRDASSLCFFYSIPILLFLISCRRLLQSVSTTMFWIIFSASFLLISELRLQRCGVKRLVYLIEGDPNLTDVSESLKTA
jgi:hypothetical protein